MMDILQIYNVSRETKEKIEAYKTLVLEWNCKFNLISKSSVEHIWERHILDSVQLYKYIRPTDKILLDLGSGAGFPGMVLAIMAEQLNPELSINLVESIGKKTLFLNAVKNSGISEGSILEVQITQPDGEVMKTNIKVTQSDLELFEQLKTLM